MSGSPEISPRLALEFRLLCLAVRQQPDDAELLAAIAAGPDWTAVIEGAKRHRVVPLVLSGLQRHAATVPGEVVEELRRLTQGWALRSLAQATEVAGLARSFAEAGIRVMVLKGVVLSLQVHGTIATRGAGDIDLLVDPRDLWTADAALSDAGYRMVGAPISQARRSAGQHLLCDLTYRRGAHTVELHQRFATNPHCLVADFEALWHEREVLELGGVAVATLPARFLPVYLCAHGARHCWQRLRWVIDLALLLEDRDRGSTAMADAEALGLGPAMRTVQAIAADWLGASPDGADPAAARRFVARFFAGDRWRDEARRGTVEWLQRWAWRRLYIYTLKRSWAHAGAELVAELTSPIDWNVLHLPDRLLWLYPLLRPVGWCLRNFRGRGPDPGA